MTKFLKKVFVCGILLSSVGAYCSDGGTVVDVYPQLADGKLSLDEGSVEVNPFATANMNWTVGSLATGLVKATDSNNSGNEILQASNLVVANKTGDDGLFTQVFANNNAIKVVPVGGDSNYRFGSGELSDYIYVNIIDSSSESIDNYSFKKTSDGWQIKDDDSVVQVINLAEENSPFTLSGDKLSLSFTGTLATKTDGVWKLASDDSPLNKAELIVAESQKLTMGNTQVEQPMEGGGTVTVNNGPTTLTVTEFGKVSGSIELMNDEYTGDPETQTQWETKAIFEPGSEAADGTTITNGTTVLGKYLSVKDDEGTKSLEAKSTEGESLNLAISGKVDVFSEIILSDADAATKSETINLINNSNIPQVFPNITSDNKITLEVPYTYNIEGGSAYNSIADLASNVAADNKVLINLVSKDTIAGLFKNDAKIDYTVNGQDTTNIPVLIDNTIAEAHNIAGTEKTDVYLDVSSLKKFDKDFKSDEYFYNGAAGGNKLNMMPIDDDAYVIPYNDKSTATDANDTTVTAFDLKASTDKNPDVIEKYIEPKMKQDNDSNIEIKASNGETLLSQPTITYSTELSEVGASSSNKVLLLNSANNDLNRAVSLNKSYLNVKSKDGSDINMSSLNVNNGSNINLYGTNTVQNLVMDSTSKLRIRGKFTWGSQAV